MKQNFLLETIAWIAWNINYKCAVKIYFYSNFKPFPIESKLQLEKFRLFFWLPVVALGYLKTKLKVKIIECKYLKEKNTWWSFRLQNLLGYKPWFDLDRVHLKYCFSFIKKLENKIVPAEVMPNFMGKRYLTN